MWYLTSAANLFRQCVSISLLTSIFFLTPYSFSFHIDFTNAEEITATSSSSSVSESGDGGDGGTTGEGGDGGVGGGAGEGGSTEGEDVAATSTVSGGDGGDGGEENATSTEILTGNSTTSVDITNLENNNSVTLNNLVSSTTSSTTLSESEEDPGATTTPQINISITNVSSSTASTSVDLENKSGENTASSTGPVVVKTGDVISNASLLNVVNTNLVNSYGELLNLSNMLRTSVSQFDLRNFSLFTGSSLCTLCGGTDLADLRVLNNSTANLSNYLSARAASGGNGATSNSTSTIETGNAYAAGNIINFANNNIVDSNFLFLTYNNFGDSSGDIVFPNSETLLKVLSDGKPLSSHMEISTQSEANIADNLSLRASSGNNSFQSFGSTSSSTISTGSSATSVNILNLINSNLLGGGSLNVLFNVQGEWSGTIFGLPPGVNWKDTGNGFVLSYDSYQNIADTISAADGSGNVRITNDASVDIENTIDLDATSGDNSVAGTGGEIKSGNAYAAANVINVANTNMIGRNMFWAIINIFGNWSGDLTFGKPDLWIGGHADMDGSTVGPGGTVTYHFTVINNGDLAATDVKVKTDLGTDHLSQSGSDAKRIVETVLGTIDPHESKSFDIIATVDSKLSLRKEMVTTQADVMSAENDNNSADNSEHVAVVLGVPHRNRSSKSKTSDRLPSQLNPFVEVVSMDATTTATSTLVPLELSQSLMGSGVINASSSVDYSVKIYNPNNAPVFNAEYHERVIDESGNVLHGEIWDLGKIDPYEEINLTYSVFFSSSTPAGVYINRSIVNATINPGTTTERLNSNVALTPVTVGAKIGVGVAGRRIVLSSGTASTTIVSATEPSEEIQQGGISIAPSVLADNGEAQSLLASAFFGTPTGKQMSVATIVLVLLTLGLMAFSKKRREQ